MQRLVTCPVIDQEGENVVQNLPEQPARQMPQIARPHPLDGVSFHDLREDSVDAAAKPAPWRAPIRMRIPRSEKLAHGLTYLSSLGLLYPALQLSEVSSR